MNMSANFRNIVPVLSAIMAVALCYARISSAQVPNVGPGGPSDTEAADFYRADKVQSIHLAIAEDDMRRMLAALPERIYVPATFRWGDISFDKVAVRFKGNSSSAPQQQHKRGFLIKFDEYLDKQRFLGLRRVSFDNAVQFGSLFSEPIITEILHDEKVPAHRCNYAKLFLNEKYHGVYVNVERIDETFIENHFSDPNGLLFKVDEGGPGGNLQFVGDDPAVYARTFEPETKPSKKGLRRLVQFVKLVDQSAAGKAATKLDESLAVDDFLRTTAVLLFSGAFDQLTGWNPHNYYLYFDGKKERWHYLPWDLDVGFCETAFGQLKVLADWNAAWPAAGQLPNPLLDRIVGDPALLERYRRTARSILEKYFEPERLCAVIDAKYALIKDDLAADPFPHRRVTNPEDRDYGDIVAAMKNFVRRRYSTAREQLEDPGKRPERSRPPNSPPPQLIGLIQRVQKAAERMQRKGEDLEPIHKLMQQVGPLLQQGRTEDAERIVREALKLSGENPGNDAAVRPIILAHYMPWFEARPASSAWGWHWTMNAFDPEKTVEDRRSIASHFYPLVGPYDSGDPHVLEYHLLLMKLAGIDGVLVDWYGLQDFRDYALLHKNTLRLIKQANRLGMKFAVCYEDQTIPALLENGRLKSEDRVSHVAREIEWLVQNWFALDSYVRLDGRAVLLSFGQNGLKDAEWSQCLERVKEPVAYFSLHHRRTAALGAFDWPLPGQGLESIEGFRNESRDWPGSIPVAFPRFVDIYAEAKVHASHGRIEDDDGATFRMTLEKALAANAPLVQIATWNDWGEGTIIEPSREFAYRDLEVIQKLRRKQIDVSFTPEAADLRLPIRLLELRRKSNSFEEVRRLDHIAEMIAAGKLAQARPELGVDGPRQKSR